MKLSFLFVLLLLFISLTSIVYASEAECRIELGDGSYEAGKKIAYKPKVEGLEDYTIEYWIEDREGEFVKKPRNTTNSNKKSFTPKEEGVFVIKMKVGDLCSAEEQITVGSLTDPDAEIDGTIKKGEKEEKGENTLEISLAVNGMDRPAEENPESSIRTSVKKTSTSSKSGAKSKPKPKSKAAALTIWFLLFLITLFCIVLIWRR